MENLHAEFLFSVIGVIISVEQALTKPFMHAEEFPGTPKRKRSFQFTATSNKGN